MNKCTDCTFHHTNSSYDGDKKSHCYMFKNRDSNDASHCYMFKNRDSNDAGGQFKSVKNPELKCTNGTSFGVPIGFVMSGKGRSVL